MNKRFVTIAISVAAIVTFVGAAIWYGQNKTSGGSDLAAQGNALERPYSPKFGPDNAPVTIVEFFDPSCEACRAFYPIVKQVLAAFPQDVRLVLRYAPLHDGSDEVVRLLEAARLQGQYLPVLEAVLRAQPEWAVHGNPRVDLAWAVAGKAGLDLQKARIDAESANVMNILAQDKADMAAVGIQQTPTFFVNGKPLVEYGAQGLFDLVTSEVINKKPSNAPLVD